MRFLTQVGQVVVLSEHGTAARKQCGDNYMSQNFAHIAVSVVFF
jgi:hypothetical protein